MPGLRNKDAATVPCRATSRAAGETRPGAKQLEVLEAAAGYFLAHGFEGASVSAMARSAGISKESIYRYFNSKQELFEAVICREFEEYQKNLDGLDAVMKSMNLRDALITVSETILRAITTDRSLALTRLVFVQTARMPALGRHWYRIGPQQAQQNLEAMFEAHGVVSPFDHAKLSQYFLAMVVHRMMLDRECGLRAAPTAAEIGALSRTLADDFLEAFLRDHTAAAGSVEAAS